ncbi:hypothetical protein [Actinophytocola sediminis]
MTHLDFHPLTFVAEPDGVTVGRPDIGSFVQLPADGAELLRRLADGLSTTDAATWYATEFGETVDLEDFVDSLRELGFVRTGDDSPAEATTVSLRTAGRAAFSPVAWLCYAGVLGVAVVAMVAEPVLRPHYHNVFFTSSLVIVQLVLALAQLPAALLHEFCHMLAGRRLGLPSRLGVGRRWYYFVFETELNGLLGVPRAKRYLPFLAGMVGDLVLFGCLMVVAVVDLPGGLSLAGRFALAVAYVTLLRLAWQFYLLLRTDLYYVLTTALGCTNPHEATVVYLRRKFRSLPGVRPSDVDFADFSPRDRKTAPAFAWITAGGVLALLVTAVFAVVPIAVEFVERVGSALAAGATQARFWDSLISLALLVVQFVVLPLLAGGSSTPTPSPTRELREEAV